MSSAGRAANSSGCVARPRAREIGLIGFAAQIRRSSLTGSYVMETAEHREPCESRGSRTVFQALASMRNFDSRTSAGRPYATNRRAAIAVTAITKWSIAVARAGAFNCPTREPRPNRRRAGTPIAIPQTLDPYGVYPELPEEYQQVGREYFARSPGSDVWVEFGDLPEASRDALWKKHRSKLAFPAGLMTPVGSRI